MDAPANRATRKERLSRKNEAASVRACTGTFILITLSAYRFHFSAFTASQLACCGAHLRFSPKIEMDRETTADNFVPSPLQGLRDDCAAVQFTPFQGFPPPPRRQLLQGHATRDRKRHATQPSNQCSVVPFPFQRNGGE